MDAESWNAYVKSAGLQMTRIGPKTWLTTLRTGGAEFDTTLHVEKPGQFSAQSVIMDLDQDMRKRQVVDRSIRRVLVELGREASTAGVVIQDEKLLLKVDALGVTKGSEVYACLLLLADWYPRISRGFLEGRDDE